MPLGSSPKGFMPMLGRQPFVEEPHTVPETQPGSVSPPSTKVKAEQFTRLLQRIELEASVDDLEGETELLEGAHRLREIAGREPTELVSL